MSRESSVNRELIRPDLPPVWLASSAGLGRHLRSARGKSRPTVNVVPPRSRSMVLRSHSRAGRSKSFIPEKSVGATKLESKTVQPEMEDTPHAGRAMREIPDSPDIDSSGETGKTPSGPILHDRREPEMEIAACPPVPPPSSNSPPLQIGPNRGITETDGDFT